MGPVVVEFGSPVLRRAQILIAFKHGPFCRSVEFYHAVKPRQLRADHEICLAVERLQHMQYHARDGRFSV